MNIFVAGATGVIGRRLIPMLVSAGGQVTAVARSKVKSALLDGQGATPVEVDLFDPHAVREAVAGHNIVINIATRIPSGSRIFLPGAFKANIRIRMEASRNLANAAIATRAQRFVQESFAPAYPDRGDEWIDEDVPIMPGKYIESVVNAESAAQIFTRSGGTGIVLRFSMLYSADSSLEPCGQPFSDSVDKQNPQPLDWGQAQRISSNPSYPGGRLTIYRVRDRLYSHIERLSRSKLRPCR